MSTIVHGPFEAYTPTPTESPEAALLLARGAKFLRTPAGDDWYALAPTIVGPCALVRAGRVVQVAAAGGADTLFPAGAMVVETDAPLAIGMTFDGVIFDVEPIGDVKARRIAAAWAAAMHRCEIATVSVATAAGTHVYGLDAVTRANIANTLLGVVANLTPNPRPWTPKGSTTPVLLSHDDIKLVAGTIGAAFDAHIQSYVAHKASLTALTAAADVAAYDLTTGWPQ